MPKKKDKDNPEIIDDRSEVTAEVVSEAEQASEQPDPAEELRAELAAEKDRYLRLAAEYDNYRKRSQKEREALFLDVKCETVSKLLPIYDNLARALSAPCSDEAFYKGVEMTMNQFMEIMDKLGIEKIPSLGEKFNPEVHNAVMHVEDDCVGENVVVEEFQTGFILGEKVIRYSTVKVAN
ncbi:MAG: nucleotide exchange factor GrpE [Clostridiales bacterium]|jgi:molecular chaperone GrpE|nr:nucleotide exchange factor GrpE [Clostridiales bacterium]